jgi:hypothetical protein
LCEKFNVKAVNLLFWPTLAGCLLTNNEIKAQNENKAQNGREERLKFEDGTY